MLDEIVALSALRSKHVVQIYDVVRNNKSQIVGVIEEFIPGEELISLIPLESPERLLKIAYSIACGVADIHAAGIVHRDIKPQNIRLDAEGCIKIFDFGLARAASAENAATQGAVGTRGYMAPELCVAPEDRAEFGPAVDVYAFGATLLRLTNRALPLPLRQFPPALPCAEADFLNQAVQLPEAAAKIANRCLAQTPEDRPEIADVRDVLGAELLRDRHRAAFVFANQLHVLSGERRAVNITIPGKGTARVGYDGTGFSITPTAGSVFINNIEVLGTYALPGSCVMTFGALALGANREHIPIDVSHPEVIL